MLFSRTFFCRFFRSASPLPALALFLLLAGSLAGGCAQKSACIDSTLAAVSTFHDARYRFGTPQSSTTLADGTVKHEWLLDVNYHQPGRYVTEPSPWVRYDSDGYRIETDREVWKRPKQVTKFCRLTMIADAQGKVLSAVYEGEDCCDLVLRPVGASSGTP